MHPGLQRGNADRRVLVMRRGDDDGIHFARRDQFLSAVEDFQSFGFVRIEFLRRGAANSDEFATQHLAFEQIAGVVFADIAHADDAKTNFVHTWSKRLLSLPFLGQLVGERAGVIHLAQRLDNRLRTNGDGARLPVRVGEVEHQ